MDAYLQFMAWLDSLDEHQRAEVLRHERGDELPPWMVHSLHDAGVLTVTAEITDGEQHVAHLLTARQEDDLETIRVACRVSGTRDP